MSVAIEDQQGQQQAPTRGVDKQLADELVARARVEGLELTGPDGLLGRVTKAVLEGALQGEMDDHLGYAKHDAAGRDGGNSRNGTRTKTVLTDIGPVEIEVPRDREASFEPNDLPVANLHHDAVDEHHDRTRPSQLPMPGVPDPRLPVELFSNPDSKVFSHTHIGGSCGSVISAQQ